MKICLIIAYIGNLIDYLFTLYWVRKFGIECEANPIGRWMFNNNVAWFYKIIVLGGLLWLLGVYIRKHPKSAYLAWICLIVYGLIIVYHIGIKICLHFHL